MKRLFAAALLALCGIFAFSAYAEQADTLEVRQMQEILDGINYIRESLTDTVGTDSPNENFAALIRKNITRDIIADDFNLMGLVALVFSFVSLIIAFRTLSAQERTEKNTTDSERHSKKAPVTSQIEKLNDLPRHFYRNLVCTCALVYRFYEDANYPKSGGGEERLFYPSESHLLKLQTLPDDIFLPIDVIDDLYTSMHELKLLFRNYNIEVEVASQHLAKEHIRSECFVQDFDNLLFKPFYLTQRTFTYNKILSGKQSEAYFEERLRIRIVAEHLAKIAVPGNFRLLLEKRSMECLAKLQEDNFSFFPKTIDKKGGIDRSLSKIYVGLRRQDILDNVINDKNRDFINAFMSVGNEGDFMRLVSGFYNISTEGTDSCGLYGLYSVMKGYFDCLRDREWNFREVFYHILSVDTAIETNKIGMINFGRR